MLTYILASSIQGITFSILTFLELFMDTYNFRFVIDCLPVKNEFSLH